MRNWIIISFFIKLISVESGGEKKCLMPKQMSDASDGLCQTFVWRP